MIVNRVIGLAAGCIIGIVWAMRGWFAPPAPAVMALGAVSLWGLVLGLRRDLNWQPAVWGSAVVPVLLLGLSLGYLRTQTTLVDPLPGSAAHVLAEMPDRSDLQMRGVISEEPELRGNGRVEMRLRLSALRVGEGEWQDVGAGDVLLSMRRPREGRRDDLARYHDLADPRAYGYTLEVSAQYRQSQPDLNPGGFNMDAFMAQRDLLARFITDTDDCSILERGRGNAMTEVALAAKRKFLLTYRETIRGPASRLVAAATLGVRRAVEGLDYKGEPVVDTFRRAGVGHVLAVSGLHVSVVALLLYVLFKAAGLGPRALTPPVILCLVTFALLTGARPSSVRAVIMNSMILVAFSYFRCSLRVATYVGLSVSSLVILFGNPRLLIAPSFLLSYGAVLALVLLAPPIDRWLQRLRGFALLFFVFWLVATFWVAALRLDAFLDPFNLAGGAGVLWLCVLMGGALNDQMPKAWRWGLDRIPAGLRMFLSAQLAIQVGMMIPLSAWFFGQLPVAGVLVNLLAIPMIGVLVQLGMLTGLCGLIPVLGIWLAIPFGAAASIVGEAFFAIAHYGALWFPFPATPKPTLTWMIVYVLLLGVGVYADRHRARVQSAFYRLPRVPAALPFVAAVILSLLPMRGLRPASENAEILTCYAMPQYPAVSVVTDSGRACLINAGDTWGSRSVFDVLREQGVTRIDTVMLPAAIPRAGNEGLTSILERFAIDRCLMGAVPEPGASYVEALGDDYIVSAGKQGKGWAMAYGVAYRHLRDALAARNIEPELLSPGRLIEWGAFTVDALPIAEGTERRFVSSARTPVLMLDFRGTRWMVITDSTPAALEQILSEVGQVDVVLVPDLSSRKSYGAMLDRVLEATDPRVVIFSGDRAPRAFDPDTWAASKGDCVVFATWRDGAVTARASGDGLDLTGTYSGRRERLPAN